MRISPGAAVAGVAVGSALAQATAVTWWWLTAGPWYFAYDYIVIGFEPPVALVTVAVLLLGGFFGLVPALVFVPVMRRWTSAQRIPAVLAVLVLALLVSCTPLALLHDLPDARTSVLTVLGGALLAFLVGAPATIVVDRRASAEAAAIAAAFREP
ncbi:hypothetical protein [Homoserinibacter sp. GY 40078]|uniref:hypothetical protein n=1 Tax=Homoserinibacter sp. GY 40078 TaxID=2603275 RepID=UPI0011C9937F|nr:hypothetical protein [Homoserinibacter sp. GY 40078]TXK19019.1 hypothetical protein FVQ89_03560 [Homoserinibacter sp. GY 40078]